MEKEQVLSLLNDFCSKDRLRTSLINPSVTTYKDVHYYAASNGTELLMIPISLIKLPIKLNGVFPDCTKILESMGTGSGRKIKICSIQSGIDKCPLVDEYNDDEIECSECDGDGEVECDECGHIHDCKKCHGTGIEKHSTKTGNKIPNYHSVCGISGIKFRGELLFLMKKIIDCFEYDIISHSSINKEQANLFTFKDILLIAMPNMSIDTPFYKL